MQSLLRYCSVECFEFISVLRRLIAYLRTELLMYTDFIAFLTQTFKDVILAY